MDLLALLRQLRVDGSLIRLANNPLIQFGARTRRYLGATLLPERIVPDNMFTEDSVRFLSIIANAGPRYGPVQLKGGVQTAGFDVKLHDSDIGQEFTSRDLDALIAMLRRNANMQAMAQLTNWADTALITPLVEYNERLRWKAIENAQNVIQGDNGYEETIDFANPAGHRVNIAAAWTNDANDPFDDIFAIVNLLAGEGITLGRIITSTRVLNIMGGNAKVQTRAARIKVSAANGAFTTVGARASREQINGALREDGLPPIETYDLMYRTNAGAVRFLSDSVMVFIGASGRDESIDLGDNIREFLPDTLGYTAIGRAAGQATPGRVVRTEFFDNKPPRIEGESWQASGVVLTEPNHVAVLKNI